MKVKFKPRLSLCFNISIWLLNLLIQKRIHLNKKMETSPEPVLEIVKVYEIESKILN